MTEDAEYEPTPEQLECLARFSNETNGTNLSPEGDEEFLYRTFISFDQIDDPVNDWSFAGRLVALLKADESNAGPYSEWFFAIYLRLGEARFDALVRETSLRITYGQPWDARIDRWMQIFAAHRCG